ncbi:MAG: HD domain-containing protein [Epsilonproteobacteria bacterium]|nr:HD domain-containing protein [Campylobacterota bacterium]
MDTQIFPLINEQGEIFEHLHLMYDVTDIVEIHQELEATQKEIIYKMGEIGESRSKETGNHVKRVAEYSKLLASLSGLTKKDAEVLFTASPMHDIGKVAIPDAILNKPGKLTSEEFEIMKKHAEIGYNILKSSQRKTLKAAAIVAYTHHEKWDGSGYPNGTKGKNIHIFGRITAIADVFDALGSDRAYKKAWNLERILELFKKQRGKHFDPKLVDLFFDNLEQFLSIRDKFQDSK